MATLGMWNRDRAGARWGVSGPFTSSYYYTHRAKAWWATQTLSNKLEKQNGLWWNEPLKGLLPG